MTFTQCLGCASPACVVNERCEFPKERPTASERAAHRADLASAYTSQIAREGMFDPLPPTPPSGHASLLDVGLAGPSAEKCEWPRGNVFTFLDELGEHDPCYVIMPDGAMLPLNHHAAPGVDIARARFIIAACNRALAAPTPLVGGDLIERLRAALADALAEHEGDVDDAWERGERGDLLDTPEATVLCADLSTVLDALSRAEGGGNSVSVADIASGLHGPDTEAAEVEGGAS